MKRPLLALLVWLLHLMQPLAWGAQCSVVGEECCCTLAPAADCCAAPPAPTADCCAAPAEDPAASATEAPACGCWELPETPVEPVPPALPQGQTSPQEAPARVGGALPPAGVRVLGSGRACAEAPPGRAVPIWLTTQVLRL